MTISKQLLEAKICNKENCEYKEIINKLEEYLYRMEDVTTGKYHEAIKDTIYFLNVLKELKEE